MELSQRNEKTLNIVKMPGAHASLVLLLLLFFLILFIKIELS